MHRVEFVLERRCVEQREQAEQCDMDAASAGAVYVSGAQAVKCSTVLRQIVINLRKSGSSPKSFLICQSSAWPYLFFIVLVPGICYVRA